jgi:YfiH family protein
MRQVHGSEVVSVTAAGTAGEGDALVTDRPALPLAVRTADCVPVVVHAATGVAVAHAGWRGLSAGVLARARAALADMGAAPERAAIGPAIGSCCYEVGEDVAVRFPEFVSSTSWGTQSVDLVAAAKAELSDLQVWSADLCTMCESGFHSHRETGTARRQVTIGWM